MQQKEVRAKSCGPIHLQPPRRRVCASLHVGVRLTSKSCSSGHPASASVATCAQANRHAEIPTYLVDHGGRCFGHIAECCLRGMGLSYGHFYPARQRRTPRCLICHPAGCPRLRLSSAHLWQTPTATMKSRTKVRRAQSTRRGLPVPICEICLRSFCLSTLNVAAGQPMLNFPCVSSVTVKPRISSSGKKRIPPRIRGTALLKLPLS